MTDIATDKTREIISDFAEEIKRRKTKTAKPSKAVIDFRDEMARNVERDVWVVPTEILRFRKENGRITSDVLSFEKNYRPLSEKAESDQKILGKFLRNKDPEKTKELTNSLFHSGQRQPAIITCDGFLINGNRRKLALEILQHKHPGDDKSLTMKVVILPGEGDEGGPPTIKDIEKLENRYQLQSEGKAEYYNFDRALSMRRKIESGITLEEQLRDDPNFVNLSPKKFKKEKQKIEDEFLEPLHRVDQYLEHLGRDGLYDTVSKGRDDREGRWQAFIDYHNYVYKKLMNRKKRIEMGIEEEEVGRIEDVVFKIIRKRVIPEADKVHMIMRKFPKLLADSDAKEELLKISEIEMQLPLQERHSKDGNEFDPREVDKIWGEKYQTDITRHIKLAEEHYGFTYRTETPLTLLDAALKKLNHDKMDLQVIKKSDMKTARSYIQSIAERIKQLEKDLFSTQKKLKRARNKTAVKN